MFYSYVQEHLQLLYWVAFNLLCLVAIFCFLSAMYQADYQKGRVTGKAAPNAKRMSARRAYNIAGILLCLAAALTLFLILFQNI